jgi:hypothetical protein
MVRYIAETSIRRPLTYYQVAIIGFYVQCYFIYRLLVISKKWYAVTPIGCLFLFAFLSMVVATYFITTAEDDPIKLWCKHRSP